MNISKFKFLLLNIISPIIFGVTIYLYCSVKIITNYLPDGLWAYSLTSAIFFIWSNRFNVFWQVSILLFFSIYELLQYNGVINGTGDILDIFIYFLFSQFSIFYNFLINKNEKFTQTQF